MKHVAIAAALTVAATGALADGPSEPVVEPQVEPAEIEADTAGSIDHGILVPLFLLLAAAAAL